MFILTVCLHGKIFRRILILSESNQLNNKDPWYVLCCFSQRKKDHTKNKEDNAVPDDVSIIINGLSLIGKKISFGRNQIIFVGRLSPVK